MKLKDPALDLAVCLATLSSSRDAALPSDWVFIGEVGLLGEVGRVPYLENRVKEAAKAGFAKALVPSRSLKDISAPGIKLSGAADLGEAAALFFSEERNS